MKMSHGLQGLDKWRSDYKINNMEYIKIFEPAFKFPFPRGVEIVMRMFFIVMLMFFIDYIGLIDSSLDFTNPTRVLTMAVLLSLVFYCYKLMVNRTVTNKVIINYSERTFTLYYSFLYLVGKKRVIRFDDLSFWIHYAQILLLGDGIAIFVYERDRSPLKINARNGWKKKQVEEIINELLVITDGKMRRKPKGEPDEKL